MLRDYVLHYDQFELCTMNNLIREWLYFIIIAILFINVDTKK